MNKNLAFDLARVTEVTAMAAYKWIGFGDKNKADEVLKLAKAQEAGAKGRKISSEADLDDLNYLEQSSGLKQDRELEKIQTQERFKALNKRPNTGS